MGEFKGLDIMKAELARKYGVSAVEHAVINKVNNDRLYRINIMNPVDKSILFSQDFIFFRKTNGKMDKIIYIP